MTTVTATKERPILFSGAMVRAILDGTKTQTRRVIKPEWHPATERGYLAGDERRAAVCCPYGEPEDKLWVRETWAHKPGTRDCVWYAADFDTPGPAAASMGLRWRPSIHMPRWASRITLEITRVRVERVQSISEADAKAEGVAGLLLQTRPDGHFEHVPFTFQHLWDSINAKRGYGWSVNPWVWVVEFRRIVT